MAGVMYRNYEDPYSRSMGSRPNSGYVNGGYYGRPESVYSSDDDVTHDLDHLATYTLAPHRGLSSVEDALARLRRMIQTSGVWTKRLRLRIGARDLVIVEGTEPIERFPLRIVGQCVAASLCEGYENVVAFYVANDDVMRRPAEIHLFQCVGKPANELVNDIKAAKSGQPLQKHVDGQPVYSKPDRPRELNAYQTSANDENPYNRNVSPAYAIPPAAAAAATAPLAAAGQQKDWSTPSEASMTPQTSPRDNVPEMTAAEKKAFDVKMLDLCFGDIENFVTRLQHAAKDAKDTSKPDGQKLNAPEAREFFEIFQKFKVCFILLSRLKQDIRDPNASELVHMLFGPLETVAEASRSSGDNKLSLASQVVSPLLTVAAVDLLNNCLTSKQMELWRSLGPAWMTPRNRWTEDIPMFLLRFTDGKIAPKTWLDDLLEIPLDERNGPVIRKTGVTNGAFNGDTSSATRGQDSLRRQRDFLVELQARGSKAFVVTKRRDANNPKELTIEVDDVVEVLDDSKNWWSVRNCRAETGFVPNSSLKKAS